jgi:hypothetical protein
MIKGTVVLWALKARLLSLNLVQIKCFFVVVIYLFTLGCGGGIEGGLESG